MSQKEKHDDEQWVLLWLSASKELQLFIITWPYINMPVSWLIIVHAYVLQQQQIESWVEHCVRIEF